MKACFLLVAVVAVGCGGSSDHDHGDAGHPDAAAAPIPDGAAGCPSSGIAPEEATRSTEGGEVTVTARLENALTHCGKEELTFFVVLDTHAVDLLGIDVAAIASIEVGGAPVVASFTWTGTSESSHHREGTLVTGAPAGLAAADPLLLALSDVSGVPRTFEWDASFLVHDAP